MDNSAPIPDPQGSTYRSYFGVRTSGATSLLTPNGTNAPNVFYVHADHLGAPRVIVNTANQLRWRWLAEPFATTAPETNPQALGAFTFNLRLPGQYADSETGLFYNYQRDYDPNIGRYVQSDPIGLAGGINTYVYVGGNPLSYVDPMGLDVTVALYPGANGFGHTGIGVNSANTTGFYPAPGSSAWSVVRGQPVPGVMLPDTPTPTTTITIRTTPAQDKVIQDFIDARTRNPGNYILDDRNCTTTVRDALGVAGISTPNTIYPKDLVRNLQQQVR